MRLLAILTLCLSVIGLGLPATAQDGSNGTLRIEINKGVIEPLPFAAPIFIAETPGAEAYAAQISQVLSSDLVGTGLFREIPRDAYISQVTSFTGGVQYADWRAINAQALIVGAVSVTADGRISVKFQLYDVFAGTTLGQGLQFGGAATSWRRMAHKVADAVYSRITGEGGYFDSRVVFVAESGPKDARQKRLAVMDYDGVNAQYLTDASALVLSPRFSPDGTRIIYTSYESGFPQVMVMDAGTLQRQALNVQAETMTFSPRFSPNGQSVVFSLAQGGNTDVYTMDLGTGSVRQLTNNAAIDTTPSYSPDGSLIAFASDRSGTSQIYVMPATGGEARRISFGQGRYNTPVWSPRGDLIAFTKQNEGRFHIGVMRTDGSEERLLTASFLDEGPTWSPNGRVIMFTRESQGAAGEASLYSVDITGRNLRRVPVDGAASDPAWSPLLP